MSPHLSSRLPAIALACTTFGLAACGSGGGDGPDTAAVADDANPAGTGSMDTLPPVRTPEVVTAPADDASGTPTGNEEPPAADAEPPVGDGASPTDMASRFGVLSVTRGAEDDGESDAVFAAFYGLDAAVAVEEVGRDLFPAPDTCAFGSGSGAADVAGAGIGDLEALGFMPLSAGENIVVGSPAGTFATLQRTATEGVVAYAPEGGTLPAPIPQGLVADVPGDEFPAFATVRVPDAAALEGVSPAAPGAVDVDTTFLWNAGDDDGARVGIVLAIEGTDPVVSVACSAADDGEFQVPASLRARLPDGRPAAASLTRTVTRTLQRGDAVLLVVGTVGAGR